MPPHREAPLPGKAPAPTLRFAAKLMSRQVVFDTFGGTDSVE
jgi:hypothetical protein